MEKICTRPAIEKDAPAMMELIKELAAFERAAGAVTVAFEHFVESGFGPRPVWWAWVAEAMDEKTGNNKVIGFALYYIRYSTWKGCRMYLEDIIVTQEWRNRKVGSMLLERLIEVAKEKRLSGMVWQVLDWNTDAIRFYEKYPVRFENNWMNVNLDLEEAEGAKKG
jgi:GNAT superfamily N-acetyltransferase